MKPLPETPKITVVMPVYNEERFIRETLDMVLTQDYPRDKLEVLVCDGMSQDATPEIVNEIAASDSRVRYLVNEGRRSSSGRNCGFKNGTGDVFLVVDGHVLIDNDQLLRSIARCFYQHQADVLGRPQPLIGNDRSKWSHAIAAARSSAFAHSPSSFIYSEYEGPAEAASNGAAYRAEVFDRVGYVDEGFDACEDLEFNTRCDLAGLKCYTSPSLRIYYYARDSLRALFWQMFRYGWGRYPYIRRYPSRFSIAQIVPAALVLWTVATLLLAAAVEMLWLLDTAMRWLDIAAVAGLGGLAVYALANLFAAVVHAAKTKLSNLWRYLVIFPTVHYGLGCGFLSSVIRR